MNPCMFYQMVPPEEGFATHGTLKLFLSYMHTAMVGQVMGVIKRCLAALTSMGSLIYMHSMVGLTVMAPFETFHTEFASIWQKPLVHLLVGRQRHARAKALPTDLASEPAPGILFIFLIPGDIIQRFTLGCPCGHPSYCCMILPLSLIHI